MKAWVQELFDGKFHALAAYDGLRFRIYFECGKVVQDTATRSLPYRHMPLMIFPTGRKDEDERAVKWFDQHCQNCISRDKEWKFEGPAASPKPIEAPKRRGPEFL